MNALTHFIIYSAGHFTLCPILYLAAHAWLAVQHGRDDSESYVREYRGRKGHPNAPLLLEIAHAC